MNFSQRLRSRHLGLLASVALVAGCSAGIGDANGDDEAALATVAAFQNGVSPTVSYAGETDTTLLSSAPNTAQGSSTWLRADADYPDGTGKHANVVLRFDLSTIPANATVTATSLTLNVSNPTSGAGYTVYGLRRPFNESQATWSQASNDRGWTTGGAGSTSEDRGLSVLGTLAPTRTGKYTLILNASGVAHVQAWVKSPTANAGIILTGTSTDGLVFDSAQTATRANRPQLKVAYSTPGTTPTPTPDAGTPSQPGASYRYLRGVNSENFQVSAGYGNGYGPAPTSEASYRFLHDRGHRLIRLILPWGARLASGPSLQPTRQGALDATYLARLHQEVDNLKAAGLVAVLDLHTSCHYPASASAAVCGNGVSIADVKDIWTRLSREFKNDSGIYAYDLMNEPYDISKAIWQQYSQAMVDAIRANGDSKQLWVEGLSYSSAKSWTALNGAPWINDPANKVTYEAHTYPPSSNGGSWTNLAWSSANDSWVTDTQRFFDWCTQYHQTCAIGEVGIPSSLLSSDHAQFNALLEKWYAAADAAGVSVTYFSAASSWNQPNRAYDNATHNTITVTSGVKPGVVAEINRALSQAAVLEKHPSR